ncbi:MAG: outer membrane protein assembly factor BamD [Ignavibacteria bacterium]|nr:outer membrane protein assembly factor BamD [Ignavibacteria bacterium]
MRNISIFSILFLSFVLFWGCGSSKSSINTDDPEKAFSIAKRKFDKGDFSDAIEDFSFIKIRFPGSTVSEKSQFYLAESYLRLKEYLLGAYEFENFLKSYSLSELYPEAMYKLGVCYFELSPPYPLDQEYTKLAEQQFLQFIEAYPQNKNVPDAEKKVRELRNKLAYKDYRTAEIYMKNDNYKAASIYFQNVYENYIDSDWADDAMIGQAEAYIEGKKYSEAVKVLERFNKLFPASPLKSKAERLLSIANANK